MEATKKRGSCAVMILDGHSDRSAYDVRRRGIFLFDVAVGHSLSKIQDCAAGTQTQDIVASHPDAGHVLPWNAA